MTKSGLEETAAADAMRGDKGSKSLEEMSALKLSHKTQRRTGSSMLNGNLKQKVRQCEIRTVWWYIPFHI